VRPTPLPFTGHEYREDLHLLEQVHMALGSASHLDDFYVIVCSILVDPGTFGFSRAFFLRYDERSRTFSGRLALGGRNEADHKRFRGTLLREQELLNEQVRAVKQNTSDSFPVEHLADLRFHSLWIQLLQGHDEGGGLQKSFAEVSLRADSLSADHLLQQATAQAHARVYDPAKTSIAGLEEYLHLPAVAGRLITKRGLHGILVADHAFETTSPDRESLLPFQWLLNHASVTLDNVELVTELTETTRRLQEVDRMKTNFLSIVSHELRTPLTSIIGFIHLLTEGKVGEVTGAQVDLLKRVSQHAVNLQSMVNDLLEIAEVEAGGIMNVAVQPTNVAQAVSHVIPKIQARRGNKNVTIVPPDGTGAELILADPSALERILFHLLDNAVKFIHGTGQVNVDVFEKDGKVNIAVADSGIGIPKENLQRIFEHFYQVDFRLERTYGGMGIGLSVVKMLLDATGGHICVESEVGKGSRFTISYPAAATAAGDGAAG